MGVVAGSRANLALVVIFFWGVCGRSRGMGKGLVLTIGGIVLTAVSGTVRRSLVKPRLFERRFVRVRLATCGG